MAVCRNVYILVHTQLSLMERLERVRLEAMRRHCKDYLLAIDALLKDASPPRNLSASAIHVRAAAICKDVKAKGGSVSKDQLRAIATKHTLAFSAVGALFAGKYLKQAGNDRVILGSRGQSAVRTSRPAGHNQRAKN